MKIGSIGRSLMRWLRRPATSVSPQISEDAIIDRMVERGLIEPAWTREPSGAVDTRPGIKPPPDPPVDKEWCWSEWQRERDALSPPGWTYCRFPIQYPDDKAVFVFGLVRGHFGIYHTPFMVRDTDTGADNQEILAGLTLMKNGAGIGLFTCRHVAAQAAELAEKVETRWDEIDPDHQPTWRNVVERIHAAWTGAGILPAVNAYAYQARGETRWCVYGTTAETIMQGRPEKLS